MTKMHRQKVNNAAGSLASRIYCAKNELLPNDLGNLKMKTIAATGANESTEKSKVNPIL